MRELPRERRWTQLGAGEEEVRFHDAGALHPGSRTGLQGTWAEAAESRVRWHAQGEGERVGDSIDRVVPAKFYELISRELMNKIGPLSISVLIVCAIIFAYVSYGEYNVEE